MTTDQKMAQVLAEMSVLAEAPGAKHGDIVHGGEREQAPRGPDRTLCELHAERYRRAGGPVSRAQALRDAERALVEVRVSPTAGHGLTPETLEWRVAIARAEGSVEMVAHRFGVARSTVYRCRAQFAPPPIVA